MGRILRNSHLLGIDSIVGAMASHEPYVNHAFHVVDLHDKAILVAADIEDRAPVLQYARRTVLPLEICGFFPSGLLDIAIPSFERCLDGLLIPVSGESTCKFSDSTPGADPHIEAIACDPKWAQQPDQIQLSRTHEARSAALRHGANPRASRFELHADHPHQTVGQLGVAFEL